MKLFFPDSSDMVDPSFDFDSEERSTTRVRQRDDQYAHEVFEAPPLDGYLVSKGIVDGIGGATGRYTLAQKQRLLRGGIRQFFRLDEGGGKRLETMGDCGAFSYVREHKPPYSVSEVLDFYSVCDFDYGLSVDHVILGFQLALDGGLPGVNAPPPRWVERQELTLELADEFLRSQKSRKETFHPIGVAQGWSPESYARAVRALQKMGYTYIAIGGIVPLKDNELIPVVQAVGSVRKTKTRFHLLGVSRCHEVPGFSRHGVASFDTTSPLRQAFKDDRNNYHTLDGSHVAVRVPQVDGNAQVRRMILSGKLDGGLAHKLEQRCLEILRLFDSREESVDAVLASIKEYYAAIGMEPSRMELYRKTLEDRPWLDCPCDVCKQLGIHVILFRGAERNRRRGFHNLYTLYRRLEIENAGLESNA